MRCSIGSQWRYLNIPDFVCVLSLLWESILMVKTCKFTTKCKSNKVIALKGGEVGSLLTILLQISYWTCRWNNYENWSIFSEYMDKSIVHPLFLTHGVHIICIFFRQIAILVPHHSVFLPASHMPFLLPNQQHQSTESNYDVCSNTHKSENIAHVTYDMFTYELESAYDL